MWIALLWGLVGASSLVLGAWLGLARQWRESLVGSVLGFGAGALIASVSFELTEEGFRVGGPIPLAAGLTCGAVAFYAGDRVVEAGAAGPGEAARAWRWPSGPCWTEYRSRPCSASAWPKEKE